MYIQTSNESGDRKENKFGSFLVGFLYKIVTPRFMKGMVKSTPENKSSHQNRYIFISLQADALNYSKREHFSVFTLLSFISDGDISNNKISLLRLQLPNHPVPLPELLVEAPVLAVLHQLDGVVEPEDLRNLLNQVNAVTWHNVK